MLLEEHLTNAGTALLGFTWFHFHFSVYPTLTEALQRKWDEAEQLLYDELITDQVC